MIFPKVRFENTGKGSSVIKKELTFFCRDEFFDKAIRAVSLFLPSFKFSKGDDNATVKAIFNENLSSTPEGYTLLAKSGRVVIEYCTYAGLRNALATLSLLPVSNGNDFLLSDTDIKDSPAASHRGVMLDLARGVPPLERLASDMILAAKAKMNFVHLHLADSLGVAIELDSLPKEMRLENSYSKDDICALVELSEVLGLEIIPEYDMPAHSRKLLSIFPELCCEIDGDDLHTWTACAGTKRLYEIYESVIEEIIELFPGGRYFHIGGDELEFTDLTGPGYRVCHWSECRKCKKKMEKEGLRDRQELYYHFANRMNECVKSHGRQTVMWSDQIDCTRKAGLSKDILMQFWRVAGEGRGPYVGCSMDGQLKLGYKLINSFYERTYIDLEEYMSAENLSSWRWDEDPACTESLKNQIIGGEVCAWEYGNRKAYRHYDHTLPSAIMLMGDKLWNGDKTDYEAPEIAIGLTRAVLGEGTPDEFNAFHAIGSVYPPRTLSTPDDDGALSYVNKVKADKEELKRIINVLSDESRFLGGDLFRARALRLCAEYSLAHLN